MTREGNDGQVGNLNTRASATRYILCTEKTGSELFYQFRPQGFLVLLVLFTQQWEKQPRSQGTLSISGKYPGYGWSRV